MGTEEVKKTIHSQVLTVFFLPLIMAGIHGLFTRQPKEYKDEVLLPGVPRFALTAGLEATMYPLMKGTADWEIYALNRFGASAPYKVLDEKFGYTFDNIINQVRTFIKK